MTYPDWQPIETAPKDERVLLYIPGLRRVESGHYEDQKYHKRPKPFWRWCVSTEDCRVFSPTHWLPLPPPPKDET